MAVKDCDAGLLDEIDLMIMMRMLYLFFMFSQIAYVAGEDCSPTPPDCSENCNNLYYHNSVNSSCELCPICPPGHEPDKNCGENGVGEGVQCVQCEEGEYSTSDDQLLCQPCRVCSNTVVDTVCSPTNDAVCGSCVPGYGLHDETRKDDCIPCEYLTVESRSKQDTCQFTTVAIENDTDDYPEKLKDSEDAEAVKDYRQTSNKAVTSQKIISGSVFVIALVVTGTMIMMLFICYKYVTRNANLNDEENPPANPRRLTVRYTNGNVTTSMAYDSGDATNVDEEPVCPAEAPDDNNLPLPMDKGDYYGSLRSDEGLGIRGLTSTRDVPLPVQCTSVPAIWQPRRREPNATASNHCVCEQEQFPDHSKCGLALIHSTV